MRSIASWVTLFALFALTLFDGAMLALGQFGHDFNEGGPNPFDLKYGWSLCTLKVVALAISRRTRVPLLLIAAIDWIVGIVIFQMHFRHLSLIAALQGSWLDSGFFFLACVYVAQSGIWRPRTSLINTQSL